MSDPLVDLKHRLGHRHHLIGWWGLLVFVTLGIALDTMHGFKLGMYLDPANRWRRDLWRLAHFHGTLLAIVQIGFAVGLSRFGQWRERSLKLASFFLMDAFVLMPLGFFLGGIGYSEVDPSPGIFLVPIGALCLLLSVGLIAWSALGADRGEEEST
jgi:hypothetical protein